MNPFTNPDTALYILSILTTSFALPFLISWLKEETWSNKTKTVISLVACFGGACVVAYINGQVNPSDLLATAGIVFTLTQTYYALYFKNQPWNVLLEQTKSPLNFLSERKD